jgi:hypothetical protein
LFVQGEDPTKVAKDSEFLLYEGLCNHPELFGLRQLEAGIVKEREVISEKDVSAERDRGYARDRV